MRLAESPPVSRNLHAPAHVRPRRNPTPVGRGTAFVEQGRPTGDSGTALSFWPPARLRHSWARCDHVARAGGMPSGCSEVLHGSPGPRPATTPAVPPELGDAHRGATKLPGATAASALETLLRSGGVRSRPQQDAPAGSPPGISTGSQLMGGVTRGLIHATRLFRPAPPPGKRGRGHPPRGRRPAQPPRSDSLYQAGSPTPLTC